MRLLVLSGALTFAGAALIAISQGACTSDNPPATPAPADAGQEAAPPPKIPTEDEFKAQAQRSMKTITVRQLEALSKAVRDLQEAAPTDHGWDAAGVDAAAITKMREAWKQAHVAYERVEAMLSASYPELTLAIGGRYDDFMTTLGPTGDTALFDDKGVTGLHAVERVLYADVTPQFVIDIEKVIPGYKAAAFPSNATEAAEFRNSLVQKLANDVKSLLDQYNAAPVDLKFAFARVRAFMESQRDILVKTAEGKERSRYSQQTLLDLQAVLEGTQLSYKIFQPWLLQGRVAPQDPSKHGPAHDKPIQAGFGDLIAAFTAPQGDAIPQPPQGWNTAAPTEEHLKSPFGKLYAPTVAANDPAKPGSVVAELAIVAGILGLN